MSRFILIQRLTSDKSRDFTTEPLPYDEEKLKHVTYFQEQLENRGIEIFEVQDYQFITSEGVMIIIREEELDTSFEHKSIDLVKQFHIVFGHFIGLEPQLPSYKTHEFRCGFIEEEMKEATQAWFSWTEETKQDAIVKYADALGDIQYVLDGWVLNAGLQDKMPAIMAEIHRSNMTKACRTVEEAEATIDALVTKDMEKLSPLDQIIAEQKAPAYHYEEILGFFVVKRSSDGKVQKGINYEPPNLKKVIYGERD